MCGGGGGGGGGSSSCAYCAYTFIVSASGTVWGAQLCLCIHSQLCGVYSCAYVFIVLGVTYIHDIHTVALEGQIIYNVQRTSTTYKVHRQRTTYKGQSAIYNDYLQWLSTMNNVRVSGKLLEVTTRYCWVSAQCFQESCAGAVGCMYT